MESIDLVRLTGLNPEGGQAAVMDREALRRVIATKLAAQGFEVPDEGGKDDFMSVASDLFRVYREQSRLLESHLCPIDQRVQAFLDDALSTLDKSEAVTMPISTLAVDRYGLAREMSFPDNANEFHNSEIQSYRLNNGGVLHNPINDKRTTKVR